MKYEGYLKKQQAQVAGMRRLETRKLGDGVDYQSVRGLRLEAAEKLQRIKPATLGQASRISGVSPADISVLMIWLERIPRGEIEKPFGGEIGRGKDDTQG